MRSPEVRPSDCRGALGSSATSSSRWLRESLTARGSAASERAETTEDFRERRVAGDWSWRRRVRLGSAADRSRSFIVGSAVTGAQEGDEKKLGQIKLIFYN